MSGLRIGAPEQRAALFDRQQQQRMLAQARLASLARFLSWSDAQTTRAARPAAAPAAAEADRAFLDAAREHPEKRYSAPSSLPE